jgi:PIN domain nuclease of toxin-antitoxin system
MNPAPLLDTHIWLWWLLGDPRLSSDASDTLDGYAPDNRPWLCDISIWEVALLLDLKRLELDCSLQEFLRHATSPATVRVIPISTEVAVEMNTLPETFHRDPADRLIVSTARHMNLALATRDRLILDSGLVNIWSEEKHPG